MKISTLKNNIYTNISYTDFHRNEDGELVLNNKHLLINNPLRHLDSYSSKGIR